MNRGDFYLMPFLFVLLRVNNFKPKQNCGNSLIIVMFAQSLKYVSTLIKVNWHATINIPTTVINSVLVFVQANLSCPKQEK